MCAMGCGRLWWVGGWVGRVACVKLGLAVGGLDEMEGDEGG